MMSRRPLRRMRGLRSSVVVVCALVVIGLPGANVAGGTGPAGFWYKTDPHIHSVVSGDALWDLGIMSESRKAKGYNALFVTDHTATSIHEIGGVVTDHILFTDDLLQWKQAVWNTIPTAVSYGLVTTPTHGGTQSLNLAATGGAGGAESFAWIQRAANFRHGDIILRFSAYPTEVSANSGLYVSASIGGDSTIPNRPPNGYTTQGGTISPGKSTILVWQLGGARTASTDPQSRVITRNLQYNLNAWNNYVINVTTGEATWNGVPAPEAGGNGLNDIPAADRPMDYNGLTMVKMAARGTNGTAAGYFDDLFLDASSSTSGGGQFVYRNSIIRDYDTSTFKMFPGQEVGYADHVMRFNFDISNPADFFPWNKGTDSIPSTQATGYPTQLNHPGLPGGVTADDATQTLAFGADAVEVAERAQIQPVKDTMVNVWDSILQQGVPIMGTWTSDSHRTEAFGPATYIYASSLAFDPLMRSLFEGREYLALDDFPGTVIFNRDQFSAEPYPARYPTFVPDTQTTANVNLNVTAGIPSAGQVLWLRNGVTTITDSPPTSSYNENKSISLGPSFTYVRAEVRNSAGARLAMTEPIFFRAVPSLPAGMSFHVDGVQTSDGKGYTKTMTKGITAASYAPATKKLSLTLDNPANALVTVLGSTVGLVPNAMTVNGSTKSGAGSAAAFDAATNSTYFYDGSTGQLKVKVLDTASPDTVELTFVPSGDTSPPSVPTGLSATAAGPTAIDLDWNASSDNVGVSGYRIYRNGVAQPIATVSSLLTAYQDTGLMAGTSYSYTISAFDTSGNESGHSSPPKAATTATSGTETFVAVADATVRADFPSTNYGTSTTLSVDADPDVRSYLRFNVSGLGGGTISEALLRIYANSPGSQGYNVFGVANTTWIESGAGGITFNNKPLLAASATGSSGAAGANSWATVNVTSLVTGEGPVSFGITNSSTTNFSLSSREGANPPELVVTTIGGAVPDTEAPSVPSNVVATAAGASQINLSWDASTDNGVVAGYRVFRNGGTTPIATVTSGLSYQDTGLAANTFYSYTVSAFDAAATPNESAKSSPPASATTTANTSATFVPVADSYVDSGLASSNYGTNTALRVDASPTFVRSYLRFNPAGLTGTVTGATLRVWADTALSDGYDVFGVANTTWIESGAGSITSGNAPTLAVTKTGSSGPVAAGAWTSVNVTPLVGGNGLVSLALTTPSSTALRMQSRENTHPPELIVTTSGGAGPDTTAPSVPTGVVATAAGASQINLSWAASTDNSGFVAGYRIYRNGATTPTATVTSGLSYQDTGLPASTTYSYTVSAFDAASPVANESAKSSPAASATTDAAPDTEAPTVPSNVVATAAGASQIDLSWDASTDNSGFVAGYRVFRDGATTPIATVTSGLSYQDTGLAANTTYSYTVSAYDGAVPVANVSAKSSPAASATTAAGTSATFLPVADAYVDSSAATSNYGTNTALRVDASPTVRSYLRFNPSGLTGTVAGATLRVWADTAHTGYDVFGVANTTWSESGAGSITSANAPPLAATKTGSSGPVAAGTWTTVDVTPLVSGNGLVSIALTTPSTTALRMQSRENTHPPELIITTSGGGTPDTTPPSVPTGVVATAAGASQISLSWAASTDNSGFVAGYRIYRDNNPTPIATVTSGLSYQDTGLTASTTYSYTVSALDAATPTANESAKSSPPASATTDATPDTQAPTVPSNVVATAAGSSQIDLSWDASTDNSGFVAGYRIYRNGATTPTATVTSGTSYQDTGLAANTTYSYTVSAYDAAATPNESAKSSPAASATTAAATSATFLPVADSYVDSSAASTNYGTNTALRVDASPTVRSYLRFNLTGLTGTVTGATLQVWADTALSDGYDVFGVANTTWIESGAGSITSANAPPLAATKTGSSGPVAAATLTGVDVTPLVTGNGLISIALTTPSTTALRMQSRENARPPQLLVTTATPPQALVVSPLTVGVNEGSTNTFTVRLAVQPPGDRAVSVARVSGDTDLSVTGGASLTFTSANWNTPQTVTLAAASDADASSGTATIRVSSAGLASVDVTANEIEDTAAPTVASLSPADDATGVPINANLVVTFTEAVVKGSGDIVISKTGVGAVETIPVGSSQVVVAGAVVTIDPASDLANGTGYDVQIAATAFDDTAGNSYAGISNETSWNFVTVADTTDPAVQTLAPADDATGVPINANLVVTFTEAVVKGSGDIVISKTGVGAVETIPVGSSQVVVAGAVVTIDPASDLANGTGYDVQIAATAFDDTAGNSYAGISNETSWNFVTVADTTDPAVQTLAPADDATGVPINANLVVTFTEAVVKGSGDIVISKTGVGAVETIPVGSSQVVVAGAVVTIDPASDLANGTGYDVQIAATAFDDTAGNSYAGISNETSWNFVTVADTTDPAVQTLAPADDATGVPINANLVVTFTEAVVKGSGDIVISKTGVGAVETIPVGSSQVVVAGAVVTIDPASDLANGTGYDVQIAATAFDDTAGNSYAGISNETSWNFVTVADTTDPAVQTFAPADDATGVPINANLVVTFTEAVVKGSGDIVISKTGVGAVETIPVGSSQVVVAGAVVTIDPASDLANGTGYDVQIAATAFDDTAGNSYAGISNETSWNFVTVADTTDPAVQTLAPADDATGVPINANLVVTFTEAVVKGSGDIVISKTGVGAVETIPVGSSQVVVAGAVVTIDPASDLANGTGYDVQIAATAFDDTAGNSYAGISNETSWNFVTVADTTDPAVQTFAPADDATGVPINANLVVTFTEAVVKGSGDIVISKTGVGAVETIPVGSSQVVVAGAVVTIDPASDLANGTGYDVQIAATAFDDTAGNSYAGISNETSWNFVTVADTTDPAVQTFAPADDATGVPINANLVVTFDRSGRQGSGDIVISKTASVRDRGDDSRRQQPGRRRRRVVTIDPASDLANGTGYDVQIAATAFDDTAGNSYAGISERSSWNFDHR